MRDASARKCWGGLLITIGVAFAAAGLTFWFAWGFPGTTAVNQVVFGIVVHVLFGYIVVMSGITVYRSDLAVEEALVAAKWCGGGLLFMSGLVVWARIPDPVNGAPLEFLSQIVVVGSVGAAAGVLIGLNRGQAIQNARLVDERDDQRATLTFLLRLLGHDVRNGLTAISESIDRLDDHVDDDGRSLLERLDRRSESMRDLLETAETILESETGQWSTDVIDLSRVLREEVDRVATMDDVEVNADVDGDLLVEADPLIDELFRNVVENAIAHNSTDDLTVSVSTRPADEHVEVLVEDDGAGIPDAIREDLFDPEVRGPDSDGNGLGLYLVGSLVDSYGGSIDVADVDPSGTRFTIRLPAA